MKMILKGLHILIWVLFVVSLILYFTSYRDLARDVDDVILLLVLVSWEPKGARKIRIFVPLASDETMEYEEMEYEEEEVTE